MWKILEIFELFQQPRQPPTASVQGAYVRLILPPATPSTTTTTTATITKTTQVQVHTWAKNTAEKK